jgi:hypothetical protein
VVRRFVSLLCVLVLAGCGGGGVRSTLPSTSSGQGSPGRAAGVKLSTTSIAFTAVGWSATQTVSTTWSDDSRKAAGSSDTSVAQVSPPYQLAHWTAPNTYTASYFITPVGPGKATITFSDQNGYAQLFVTVSVSPSGTLYVAHSQHVEAYAPGASGPTTPQRTITGLIANYGALGGIATNASGYLFVVVNTGLNPRSAHCDVYVESPTADGSNGLQYTFGCRGESGGPIAGGPSGRIDLVSSNPGPAAIQRFQTNSFLGSFTPPSIGPIGTDTDGNLYVVSGPNQVQQYTPSPVNGSSPTRTVTFPTGTIVAITVAPDGTLYATRNIDNGNGSTTQYIDAAMKGAPVARRTIGPFPNGILGPITADNYGELYVAAASTGGTSRVDVYGAAASGNAAPLRSMLLPATADGGITALTLYQDPLPPPPPEL